LAVLAAGEHDPPTERIAAVVGDQSDFPQLLKRTISQMPTQISAGSITDAEFFDQSRIVQSAVLQIAHGFRVAVELKPIKGGRLLQQPRNGSGRQLVFEMGHRLVEWQMEKKLNKADQVAAPAAAVAVEQVFGGIDVEGGVSFPV
jgi:hypothetical protein